MPWLRIVMLTAGVTDVSYQKLFELFMKKITEYPAFIACFSLQ